MDYSYWLLASLSILMILAGTVGTVVPAMPGTPLVFAGALLLAWLEQFQRISGWTITVLGILAALAIVVDIVAGIFGAKRAGASKQAIWGATIGTFVGFFFGIVGILFGPFIGAFIGQLSVKGDISKSGKVGLGTWFGIMIGTAAKLAIVFSMWGILIFALIF